MYLNMSDPSKSCPSNWTLVNSHIRGCGRTTSDYSDCDLCITLWVAPTYSRVYDRISAYQEGVAGGIHRAIYQNKIIKVAYLDRISLIKECKAQGSILGVFSELIMIKIKIIAQISAVHVPTLL